MLPLRDLLRSPALVLSRKNPFMLSRLTFFYVILGVIGGLFSATFWMLLEYLTNFFASLSGVYTVPVMTVSGLLIGIVIHFLGEPGEISLVIDNIRFRGGKLEPGQNPSMAFSSILSISTGGSAGPEAPLVQITGSFGNWFADKLGLTGEEYRSMTIAGMAAGFTSLFGSPLGGALFALEILQHRHVVEYYKALLPAFLSSASAFFVFLWMTHAGLQPTWQFPQYVPGDIQDFLYALGLGAIGAALGWLFHGLFVTNRWIYARVPGPIYWKTALGGLVLGLIAWQIPLTRFFGHDQLNQIVEGRFTLLFLAALIFWKTVAITTTVSSGWRGGIIIPLFFLGACAGKLLSGFFPSENESFFMICLMAAVNSSVTKTPISTTILLAELTGLYSFTPVLIASLSGYFLSPKEPLISTQGK
ncbi:chloride channel protein [Leptospira gomenensis]|uniref:Chloride channel protein n=2 Tax=Leptospira gomenensis TaxID=2484974 RepID=A0A5F1YLX6_9LEPT|nr:chloride channel protein [Leptospira gomenensis]TGK34903.1 chloride channel protein [Leptospira gomenensis]TGK38523.1 chloride channel protein [Leptospira gomenensis]TGK42046.1 chloride channel protein [Leptospira gomenensis]TGK56308.1 chloride channel protein [Leptospira gomenensis]